MIQKTCLKAIEKEKYATNVSFVHLFMIVLSVVLLNRFMSSIYPILFLLVLELVFLIVKRRITVNYIMLAWAVNIGIIVVRTVTWDQTNIKIFLSYVLGFFFLILSMDEPLKLSYIFNKYIKCVIVIVLITPLVQELTPFLSIWGEPGTGIVGKSYYVHIMAFIWLAYCFFSKKIGTIWKLIAVLLVAVSVMLTGSRSNLLTIPLTIGAVYILQSAKGETIKRIIKFVVIAFVVAVCVYSAGKYFQMDSILRIIETAERMLSGLDYSNGRNALQEMAWSDFMGAPIWGIGWMNFSDYHVGQSYGNYNVHNFYLQLLCEIGIAGTIMFLMPIVYALFSDAKFIRTTQDEEKKKNVGISLAFQIYFLMSSALHSTSYDAIYILLYFVFVTYSCSIKSHKGNKGEGHV